MLNNAVKITTPTENITDKVPSDIYQIQLVDCIEVDGTDYKTGEPNKQLKFFGQIVDGDFKGKTISFFTSLSWFNGGRGSKPSKLFNLVKTVYSFYHKGKNVNEMPVIIVEEINALTGCQVRVTTEETQKGWPKVTTFLPITKKVDYKPEFKTPDAELNENIDPDEIPL